MAYATFGEVFAVNSFFSKNRITVFIIILVAGALQHELYNWFPSFFTAMFAPVNESLWEHVKIIFFPLMVAGLIMVGEGDDPSIKKEQAAWQLSALIASIFMFLTASLYHEVVEKSSVVFHIALYIVSIIVGFLLPPLLEKITGRRWVQILINIASWFIFLLILYRTFVTLINF